MADIFPFEKGNESESEFSTPLGITLYLLRCFALKYKTPRINFSFFLSFIKKITAKYGEQNELMKHLNEDTETSISMYLENLCEKKECILDYQDNKIAWIQFPRYFIDIIKNAYKEMENDPQKPFPTEEALRITIPAEFVTILNVKNDFALGIGISESETVQIMRLIFPVGLSPIIIVSDIINKKLLELAAYKIKLYLDNKRNSGYIENRLISFFKQKDIAVREMINRIIMRPSYIVTTLLEPTEFTFRFWAHFTNIVINEFMKKDTKLPKEQGYCHAAYLISFYNVYYKSIVQEEKEREHALTILDKKLKRSPFIFTLNDIYRIRDKSGYPIIKKISKTVINNYLMKKIRGNNSESLPDLIRIKTIDNKEYYIHKSSIIPLTLNKIFIASHDLRKAYLTNWISLLKKHKKSSIMVNELAFLKNINLQLKNHFPLLNSLLSYELLYMAKKDIEPEKQEAEEIKRIFHKKKMMLVPLTEIFGLNQKELLTEAKTHLPIWESIPLLRNIIHFLKKLFLGKKQIEEGDEDPTALPLLTYDAYTSHELTAPEHDVEPKGEKNQSDEIDELKQPPPFNQEAYKTGLSELKVNLVGKNTSIDEKLESLADKWNPLFDQTARKHLVQDVNSIIKDYLRSVKKTLKYQPPDLERIRTLAITLSDNRSFDKILKKDYFLWYIEVYILKLLIEMNLHRF
ncbi:MAG: hypothetical protein JXJ04_25070 [Spirochaetales bacterium]|nr:hypothetical protein [Spirochaetales bacterium]